MGSTLVLVIGPDWRIRKLIRANLEAYGFEVRSAVNGRHGLHTISEGEPDLILLDTDVPDAQLDHLVARLKGQVVRQIPIIVLVAEPPAGRKTKEAAEIRYLLKPFGVPTLLEQVRAALQASPTDCRSAIQDA